MIENYIRNVLEAALLAAGRPLQLTELAQLFDENARPEQADLRAALDALSADYGNRGIELKETATGFRIQVKRELANEVSRLWPERPPRYSRALLETLALIAYRQPITRAEIEAVRGVAVNPNIIKTVIERNWVRVVGTRDVPGRPELLGTTKEFLDYFGLRSLEELPPLAELKAMGEINLQLDLAKPGDGSGSEGGGEGSGGAAPPAEGSTPPATGNASVAAGVAAVAAGAAVLASNDGESGETGTASTANESGETATVGSASDSGEAVAASAANDSSDAGETARSGSADDAVAVTSEPIDASDAVSAEADVASEADEESTSVSADDGDAEPANAEAVASDVEAAAESEEVASPESAPEIASIESDAEIASLDVEPPSIEAPQLSAEGEAASGDVTVEVETLSLVEPEMSFESDEPAPRPETAIETGEFELAELGMSGKPTAEVIEAEFEADDLDNAASDEESSEDDEEELSASSQSSTKIVAAPRDQDD